MAFWACVLFVYFPSNFKIASRLVEDNEGTIRRIHSRVDKIEASIKTVKSVGVAISGAIATFTAWLGLNGK